MKKMYGHGEWAADLCRAFGEEPSEVRSITLHIEPDDAVYVTVSKFVDGENRKIIELIQKVAWVSEE